MIKTGQTSTYIAHCSIVICSKLNDFVNIKCVAFEQIWGNSNNVDRANAAIYDNFVIAHVFTPFPLKVVWGCKYNTHAMH